MYRMRNISDWKPIRSCEVCEGIIRIKQPCCPSIYYSTIPRQSRTSIRGGGGGEHFYCIPMDEASSYQLIIRRLAFCTVSSRFEIVHIGPNTYFG